MIAVVDVFLSYAKADRESAKLVARAIGDRGWSVFWDVTLLAGERFRDVIHEELSGARCVVVLWSKDSASSRWVLDEAKRGAARNVLVPATLDRHEIPLGFGESHAADLAGWKGASDDSGLTRLLDGIDKLLTREDATNTGQRSQRATMDRDKPNRINPKIVGALVAAVGVVSVIVLVAVLSNRPLDNSTTTEPRTMPGTAVPTTTSSEATIATESDPPESDPPLADVQPAFVYPAGINDIAPDGALASGCTPGIDATPDGVWFVLGWAPSAGSISLDFLCAYTGAAATTEAQERGDVVSKLIYVLNLNQKLRVIDLAADATMVLPMRLAQQAGLETTYAAADIAAALSAFTVAESPPFAMWIYVNNGELTEMVLLDSAVIQYGSAAIPNGDGSGCTTAQMPTEAILSVTNIAANDPDGGLNIRLGPGVEFAVVAPAPNGTTVNFAGGCESTGDGRIWWQVEWIEEAVSGWASSKTLDGKQLLTSVG